MPTDDTTPSPPVREMLIAKIDELVGMTSRDLDEIRAVTDQLEPDRAQSCRVVVRMPGDARRDPPKGRRWADRRARRLADAGSGSNHEQTVPRVSPPGGPFRVCPDHPNRCA
jgi:hypothetical protein